MSDWPDIPTGELWLVPHGSPPDFRFQAAVRHPVQCWYDAWRRKNRVVRFMGPCIVCRRATWAFDDGENDPRGVLGNAAYWATELEYRGVEYALTTCARCANNQDSYLQAQQQAIVHIGRDQSFPTKIRRLTQ